MADNTTPAPSNVPASLPETPAVEVTAAVVGAIPAAESDSIDKPACFYLGREYDLGAKKVLPDKLIMYDARNLTTHGVIVGMTGSGKTGLAIALLEEAAIDGVPAVIIDPKGDLTNLLLQFPDLSPKRFAEWLNPEDARVKNLTVDAYAKQQLSERAAAGAARQQAGAGPRPRAVAAHRLPHLHAGQHVGPAVVDPAHLRRPEGEPADGGSQPEDQRHDDGATGTQRHHGRTDAVARARAGRPAAPACLEQSPRPRSALAHQGDSDALDSYRRRVQPGNVLPRARPA